jgi:hypothetical protein
MYVCVYVCVCECMYVGMCKHEVMKDGKEVSKHEHMYVCVYVCVCECMYV